MKIILEDKDQIFIKQKWTCTNKETLSYTDETTCSIREEDGNTYVEDMKAVCLFAKLFDTKNKRVCNDIISYVTRRLLGFRMFQEEEQSECIDVAYDKKVTMLVINGKKFTLDQIKDEALSECKDVVRSLSECKDVERSL